MIVSTWAVMGISVFWRAFAGQDTHEYLPHAGLYHPIESWLHI